MHYITTLLRIFLSKHSKTINFHPCFAHATKNFEDKKSIDVLLLDMQMGGMDGVSLAQEIRETNWGIQIIFITCFIVIGRNRTTFMVVRFLIFE